MCFRLPKAQCVWIAGYSAIASVSQSANLMFHCQILAVSVKAWHIQIGIDKVVKISLPNMVTSLPIISAGYICITQYANLGDTQSHCTPPYSQSLGELCNLSLMSSYPPVGLESSCVEHCYSD